MVATRPGSADVTGWSSSERSQRKSETKRRPAVAVDSRGPWRVNGLAGSSGCRLKDPLNPASVGPRDNPKQYLDELRARMDEAAKRVPWDVRSCLETHVQARWEAINLRTDGARDLVHQPSVRSPDRRAQQGIRLPITADLCICRTLRRLCPDGLCREELP